MSIAGVILAGGQAKRYHQLAKGNIILKDGKTIIDHQIHALKESGIKDIVISANDATLYQQYNLPIVPDANVPLDTNVTPLDTNVIPAQAGIQKVKIDLADKQQNDKKQLQINMGPLAGIAATLHFLQEKHSAIITLPCDAPNITAKEIKQFITATTNNDDLVYAKTKIRAHPLFAHIKMQCLEKISQQLTNHHYKILDAWQQLTATTIEFNDETAFLNINTINDLKTLTNTNIWIITGAGHNVGKTTLATALNKILPTSVYMKIGHGAQKPNKPINYFQNINSALEFLCKNITAHKHIIIETNKKELFDYGNYVIFIPRRDAIHRVSSPNQDIRPDAELLKSMANIKINTKCHPVLDTGSRDICNVKHTMDSAVKPRNDATPNHHTPLPHNQRHPEPNQRHPKPHQRHPKPHQRHPVLDTGSRSTHSVQYSNNIMDSVVKPRNDGMISVKPRNDDEQLQTNKEQTKTTWQNTLKEIEPKLRKKIINALTKQLDYTLFSNT